MFKYFAGFVATIALIILLIVIIFGGGSSKPKVSSTTRTLDSFANTDATVSFTVDGPINAQPNHKQISITVSNNTVTYQEVDGYQGNIVKQQSYANNESAYSNFLYALEHAGFTKGSTASDLKNESGYCPLGDRYIVQVNQDGKQLERYWTTNCSGTPKSYQGNLALTGQLFKDQVPDFNDLASDLGFGL